MTSKILWTIARFLYWLDRRWWRPSGLANDIISWMETHEICCERHAKQEAAQ